MNDPYQVLGISESATDERVKRAYRELARKYHPDNYHDNPLADLAQRQMPKLRGCDAHFPSSSATKMRSSCGSWGST